MQYCTAQGLCQRAIRQCTLEHSGNNLFLKDQFLNIYAHTAKIQGTFRVNHIAKDRAVSSFW